MTNLENELERLLGSPGGCHAGPNNELYAPLCQADFAKPVSSLVASGFNLSGLFCVQDFEGSPGFTLLYVFENPSFPQVLVLQRPLTGDIASTVADVASSAGWFEREISDGFGIRFPDAPDQRPLFLHEMYPAGFHPLLKSFRNGPVKTRSEFPPEEEYRFKEVSGEGVYQIPVGPVHAGIIEPGHFRFSVVGETIFNLEVRMFYKHRGIEKLAEGKSPADCVAIAETISGDESAANATAFCLAVEKIAGATVPRRAWQLRTVLLEMERIYSHLGDMAGMVLDVAFPVGASKFYILREEMLRRNSDLTGSRFLKNIICPGGLRAAIPEAALHGLKQYLGDFGKRFEKAVAGILSSSSVIDRLERTGVIKKDIILPLNITGPAARAAGAAVDTRVDHPYGLYSELLLCKRTAEDGDVLSRFNVKAQEIRDAVEIIGRLLDGLAPGAICIAPAIKDGYTLSIVEAPRGQSLHWVYIKNGRVDRYKVRTASFCNWQAIEHAVLGNIVPDFPLINKSLNLSYAGTDL